ncbi:MAG: GTP 3',8-cyclase MoaA, partial [Planctomycetales bacterium]|nr:GTP 3',8-cyclase MoaA [Planctomycetales bacterium]
IRCFYCMPDENLQFLPREQLLSFEEIERFVRATGPLGLTRLRLTGGEPLVRNGLDELIRRLAALPHVVDLALTTNGLLLAEQAQSLRAAGLHRVNVSLDSLRPEVFERIARRSGLQRVLEGIDAALDAGFEDVRLNAVAIRGLTEDDVVPLVDFARRRRLAMRFIEFMPLDAQQNWQDAQVLTGREIRRLVEEEWGTLKPVGRSDPSRPATEYVFSDGQGSLGLITPVSEPFCNACDRLRLTAEGQLRNCLFSHEEWDARALLRGKADDQALRDLVRTCVGAKHAAHGIGDDDFQRPQRAMYQIGG